MPEPIRVPSSRHPSEGSSVVYAGIRRAPVGVDGVYNQYNNQFTNQFDDLIDQEIEVASRSPSIQSSASGSVIVEREVQEAARQRAISAESEDRRVPDSSHVNVEAFEAEPRELYLTELPRRYEPHAEEVQIDYNPLTPEAETSTYHNEIEVTPAVRRKTHYRAGSYILPIRPRRIRKPPPPVPNRGLKLTINQVVKIDGKYVRPVMYKYLPKCVKHFARLMSKKTRITRKIMNHPIQQFHLETEKTEFKNVECWKMSETVESYLDMSKLYMSKNSKFIDEIFATSVEYEGSVKMCSFAYSLRKHSCSQKRVKFQTMWWYRARSYFHKPRNGIFGPEKLPIVGSQTDHCLYERHFLNRKNQTSELQRVLDKMTFRLNRRRGDDHVILDTSYFVREFYLNKGSISLRIDRASDVPNCFVPPALACGYFPHSADTVKKRKNYLMARYKEAQLDYINQNYRDMKPPSMFLLSRITAEELYRFHKAGRHIHGFYVVWEEVGGIYVDTEGNASKKRFLVDMFNWIRFPLYAKYEHWDNRVKVAFDRTTVYNLHLAEIIRTNRPVFDNLAQNPAMFQPISLEEITTTLLENGISPQHLTRGNKHEFLEVGRTLCNIDYLSAYMIICGGTKIAVPLDQYELEHSRLFNTEFKQAAVLDPTWKIWRIALDEEMISVKKAYIFDPSVHEELQLTVVRPGYDYDIIQPTHMIDVPITKPPPEKVILKRAVDPNPRKLTRKQLMKIRRQKYGRLPGETRGRARRELFEVEKRKVGRRSFDAVQAGLKRHNFDITMYPSDFDSDYDGYLSDEENFTEVTPTLKRSTSFDSIFMDYRYHEYMLDFISINHDHRIRKVPQKEAKKRRRKMNRIAQKHMIRYKAIQAEEHAFGEMVETYHGSLPYTTYEIAKTKNAIRNPYKFYSLNLPKVYNRGDAPLVDDVFGHVSIRAAIELTKKLEKARLAKREAVEMLVINDHPPAPQMKFLVIQMLTLEQILSHKDLNTYIEALKDQMRYLYEQVESCPRVVARIHCQDAKQARSESEQETIWNHFKKREKQHRKSLVLEKSTVYMPRTAAHNKILESQRRGRANIRRDADEPRRPRGRPRKYPVENRAGNSTTAFARRLQAQNRKLEIQRAAQELERLQRIQAEAKRKELEEKAAREKALQEERAIREMVEKRLKEQAEQLRKEREEKEKKEREGLAKTEKKTAMEVARMMKEEKERMDALRKKKEEEEELRRQKEEEEKRRLEKEEHERRIRKEQEDAERKKKEEKEKKEQQEREELLRKELEKRKEEEERREREEKERLEKRKQEEEEALKKKREEEQRLEKLRLELEKEKQKVKEMENERKKQEEAEKEKEKEKEKEREKARKELILKLRTEKELPDDMEISLHSMSSNPDDVRFQTARRTFLAIHLREAMFERKNKSTLNLLKRVKIMPHLVICYLKSLLELPEKRETKLTVKQKQIYESFAKSWTYVVGSDNKRHWRYTKNLSAISEHLPKNKKKQKPLNEVMENSTYTAPVMQHATPGTVLSAMRMSLLRSGGTIPFNSTVMEFVTPGEPMKIRTPEKITIEYPSERTKEKETRKPEVQPIATPRISRSTSHAVPRKLFNKTVQQEFENDHSDDDGEEEQNNEPTPVLRETIWKPVHAAASPFWINMATWLDLKISSAQRDSVTKKMDQICAATDSFENWVGAVLGVVRVLLTEMESSPEQEKSYLNSTRSLTLESVSINNLVKNVFVIASYFEEGNKSSPANLLKLIEFDGFARVFSILSTVLTSFSVIATDLEVTEYFNKTVTAPFILQEIFHNLVEQCQNAVNLQQNKEVVNILNEQVKVSKLIMEDKIVKNKENPQAHRIYVVLKWHKSLIKNRNDGILRIREETHRRLQLKLNNIDWTEVETYVNIPSLCAKDNDVKPSLAGLQAEFIPSEPEYDSDVVCLDDSEDKINRMKEKTRLKKAKIANMGRSFARVNATIQINKEQQERMKAAAREQRRAEIAEEKAFQSNFPKFANPFVDAVFKTIERRILNFDDDDRMRVKAFNLARCKDKHKESDNPFRFHSMICNEIEADNREYKRDMGPHTWVFFKRLMVEVEDEPRLETERTILNRIEHTVLTRKEFNQMQWSVKDSSGTIKHAIEYFTDLDKYKAVSLYKKSVKTNKLPFKFKFYKHTWFMGYFVPPYCEWVDSHEDGFGDHCAGCTNGDVILIHNCTCDNHDDRNNGTFIYAFSNEPVGIYRITRLIGRFVCKHGPCSYLQLDRDAPNPEKFYPMSASYVEYEGKLRISKKKTTHLQLVETFSNDPTQLRRHVGCGSCSPAPSTSSDGEFSTSSNSSWSSNASLVDSEEDSDEEENHDVESDDEDSPGLFGEKPERADVQHSEEHKKKLQEDMEKFKNHSEYLKKRIARLEDPTLRKLRERNFNVRSNSCERQHKQIIPGNKKLKRCLSQTDLSTLTTYGLRKTREVRKRMNRENATMLNNNIFVDNNNDLDGTSLFAATGGFDENEFYEIIFSCLYDKNCHIDSKSKKEVMEGIRASVTPHLSFYRGSYVAVTPKYSEKGELLSGSPISIVMDEYYRFEQYKKSMLLEAKKSAEKIKELRTRENRPFAILINAYDKLFKFNMALFEHFLNSISKQVFNSAACWRAERDQNLDEITATIKGITVSVTMVKNAFFNSAPLIRQLKELMKVKEYYYDDQELKKCLAKLSRYVIERIRVPQTVDAELNKFSWINATPNHEESVDLIIVSSRDMIPKGDAMQNFLSTLKENYIDQQNVIAQCTQHVHRKEDPVVTLYQSFFTQNEYFFAGISEKLKERKLQFTYDYRMRSFFMHQIFLRLYDIVQRKTACLTSDDIAKSNLTCNALMVSAIASNAKPRYNLLFNANLVDQFYSTLGQNDELPFEICPAAIGTSFVTLADNIFVSAVRETRPPHSTQFDHLLSNSVEDAGENSINLSSEHCSIKLFLDKEEGMVSMVFLDKKGPNKDDRLDFDCIGPQFYTSEIRWNAIKDTFVSATFNYLKQNLELAPTIIGPSSAVGRLERVHVKSRKDPISFKHHRGKKRSAAKKIRRSGNFHTGDGSGSESEGEGEFDDSASTRLSPPNKKKKPSEKVSPTIGQTTIF